MRWPPKIWGEPLDAYGPLPDEHGIRGGDRVRCSHGLGVLKQVREPFNGVGGLHRYVQVTQDGGAVCAHVLDELEPSTVEAQIEGYSLGMMF